MSNRWLSVIILLSMSAVLVAVPEPSESIAVAEQVVLLESKPTPVQLTSASVPLQINVLAWEVLK
jgi:hypothetical protein